MLYLIIQHLLSSIYLEDQLEQNGSFSVLNCDVGFFAEEALISNLYENVEVLRVLAEVVSPEDQVVVQSV